jgi:sarcosine oxidase gamma subunit
LCPLDLADRGFATDAAARTQFAHMMALVCRCPDGYEVMVMRSFGRSAVYHTQAAMQSVAAQRNLGQSI